MKNIILSLALLLATTLNCAAQDVYTKQFDDAKLQKKAEKWATKGAWRNGFTAAEPHESVNLIDWYLQYKKNKKQWKALFQWLSTHDYMNLPKGKHPIEGTKMVVSIEDSQNGQLEKRQSESHHHNIDFQWTVKGVERFGIIEHNSSTPNCKYKPDVIHYDYDKQKARFYDSTPDKFFIFFPDDWHIAKINNDTDDQNIRVIVIKVEYVN